ncbi:MAG: methyltransferase domain-containing protein [Planctomycetes bacterium]|nr:methyltransferase domain-containing protein [Planctomycetota bacterium]
MSAAERPYVLGTGADELARLGQQHRLWSDAAVRAWRRAGIAPTHRVLDVGCGPGFAAFDLAQLVPHGAVVGVDESPGFVAHTHTQAQLRGLPNLQAVVGDVHDLAPALRGQAPFDLAYARWVLCFVRDPEAVVAGVAAQLRPGGALVVHDYFNYGAMTMAPRRRSHDLAVAATIRSWRERGGDPDVMARVPAFCAAHGLEVEHLQVHVRAARGTDAMFAWLDTWWRTFAPKLVAMGLLAQADCDELFGDLAEIQRDPTRFVQCPSVYELVARRR